MKHKVKLFDKQYLKRALLAVLSFEDQKLVFGGAFLLCALDLLLKSLLPFTVFNGAGALGIEIIPANWLRIIILGAYFCAVGFFGYFFSKKYQKQNEQTMLILGSLAIVGFSNIFDRIVFGAVRDYINLGLFWVNLADIWISWTIVFLVRRIIETKKHEGS